MCHYRHHAHGDPLFLPGLQDITAHVDFTGMAEAGIDAGLKLLGYTTQAQFLVNTGITQLLQKSCAGTYANLSASGGRRAETVVTRRNGRIVQGHRSSAAGSTGSARRGRKRGCYSSLMQPIGTG